MNDIARGVSIGASAFAVLVVWLAVEDSVRVGVAFLYLVPIALACWWFGRPGALISVAGCLALFLFGAALDPIPRLGTALAVRGFVFVAAAIVACFLRERLIGLEHSAEELDAIRAALAPSALPSTPGAEFATVFVPSELGVSGDFFLVADGPGDSTLAIVGDVVGHGPRAAQLATFVRARIAAFAANSDDPAELLMLGNRALIESPRRDAFVSAVCLRYSAATSRLAWAVAGHPAPLRLPDLSPLEVPGATLLLGVDPALRLVASEVRLDPECGVLVYTDGATDVRGGDGSTLGQAGFVGLLRPLAGLSATALADRAERALLAWAESPIRDDLCMLAMRPRLLRP